MADEKITQLTEATSILSSGLFPMVEVSTGITKKVAYSTIIGLPHANISDSTTQTITGLTTSEYAITFNSNDLLHNITHSTSVNPSRVYIDYPGTYLITFSAIGKSTSVNKTLDIWLKVDGQNVPGSNTVSRFVGTGNERIITITYIYEFTTPNQYFELYWCSNDSGTTLVATGTQTNPTRPTCPSIILTVNKISS